MINSDIALSVENLKVYFPLRKQWIWSPKRSVKAVDNVSFNVRAGETLGIVGESGSGKSTLIRSIVGLVNVTSGKIFWRGNNLTALKSKEDWRSIRRDIQIIFQDPFASFNPKMTIGNIISEPIKAYNSGMSIVSINKLVKEMMDLVALSSIYINRYPHQLSGGQCQRVGIARALILKPSMIVCDEPVSALDVSVQAQVINLLINLQKTLGLTILFVTHNFGVVKHIADHIMVMYLGNIMEVGKTESLCDSPKHPYTKALLSSVLVPDLTSRDRNIVKILEGDLSSSITPPRGCVFNARCIFSDNECLRTKPGLRNIGKHKAACLKIFS